MSTINLWNYPVFQGSLEEIDFKNQKHFVINTISPNSYGLATKTPQVKDALQKSDILILDGLYFGLVALFKQGVKINRIAGWDAFMHYSSQLNERKGRVFFLGSTKETLERMKKRFNSEFPNVEVGVYSPPFKSVFSEEDNQKMIQAINDFQPNVVFVGMTAPKQEVWAVTNTPFLNVNIVCSIGNVFDWYAGNSKRPNVFWQRMGMEWLIRIFYRREIFRRNIGNQMIFFRDLLLDITKIKRIC